MAAERKKNLLYLQKRHGQKAAGFVGDPDVINDKQARQIEKAFSLGHGWMDLRHVSVRTWQYWESGRMAIPGGIDMEIYALIQMRADMIDDLLEQQEINGEKIFQIKYYHAFDQYLEDHPDKNRIHWRIHQSAVSSVFSDGGDVELI